MIGIYFLVTLLTQFTPANVVASFSPGPAQIFVSFDKINGLKTGAPVVADGQLIGSVSRIERAPVENEERFTLELKISPHHRSILKKGTVALIASPLTTARVEQDAIVELLIPQADSLALVNGERIKGFSSYELFWSEELPARTQLEDGFAETDKKA